MTITRPWSGGYEICDIVAGRLLRRRYFGYTRREAIALFRKARREEMKSK